MPRRSPFFIYSPSNSEEREKRVHVLFHDKRPKWMIMNDTGLEIARRLEQGGTVGDVSRHLAAQYRIPVQTASQDVTNVFNQLAHYHILAEAEEDGYDGILSARVPRLRSVFLHLTNRCNLACAHCYASCPDRKTAEDLPVSLVFRLVDELTNNGGQTITLSGGEPLLHPKIKEILAYAASKAGIRLLTNGTLIDREWASFLADLDIHIQVSLDGSKEEIHEAIRGRGSFTKSLKAIEYLQEAGLGQKIHLATTIMKQNLHNLEGIIALAEKLNIPLVRFLPLRQVGCAKNQLAVGIREYERFFSSVADLQANRTSSFKVSCGLSGVVLNVPKEVSEDDFWCPVGRQLVIDTQGNAYPCVLLMDESFRLGNAFHHSLSDIIHSERMANTCRALVERRIKIEKCAACKWRNLCQSGCMGQALEHKGTIWDKDNFCPYRKRAYRMAFDKILHQAKDDARKTLFKRREARQELNQELNQELSQELNRELNQEVNQGVNRELSQGVNQEANQGANQGANQEVNQGVNQEVNQGVNQGVKNKISRPQQYHSFFQILDVGLSLTSDSAEFLELFERDYGWFQVPSLKSQRELICSLAMSADEPDTYLCLNDRYLSLAGHPHKTSYAYQMILEELYGQITDFFLLHAGCIAKDGRAVIIAGLPGAGKTTLVLALLKRGYHFLSDDLCPIHKNTKLAYPFPRTVWVAKRGGDAGHDGMKPHSYPVRSRKSPVRPRDLASAVVQKPCQPACILCLDAGGNSDRGNSDRMCQLEIGFKADAFTNGGMFTKADAFIKADAFVYDFLHLEGVRVEPIRGSGPFGCRITYPQGFGLTQKIKELLKKYEHYIWNAYQVPSMSFDFSGEPVLTPLQIHEAVFFLMADLKQELTSKRKNNNLKTSPGEVFLTLCELLNDIPCYRLSVGSLQAMEDRVLYVTSGLYP